jgi:N-acyl-D-amino-acid deacylase
MELDLVVRGGVVIDGTGAPRFEADVGIQRGRIRAIVRGGGLNGARAIDAAGLVIAPGFVDIDSHVDWAVAQVHAGPALARWLRQGATTVIGGACGFSPAPVLPGGAEAVGKLGAFLSEGALVPCWTGFGEFLEVVASAGAPLNLGFLVGQNTLRAQATGGARFATPEARAIMLEQTREALRAGALGLSANTGFVPGAFADQAELAALADLVARQDALLAVHARAYTWISPVRRRPGSRGPHNVSAIRELLDLSRAAGARLHVFHLMLAGRRTWRTCGQVLGTLDAGRSEGIDVSFDATPYTVAVGPLQLVFPDWFVAEFPDRNRRGSRALRWMGILQRALLGMGYDDVRLRHAGADPSLAALEGLSFAEIGRRLGMSAVDAQIEIARRVGMNGASVMVGGLSGDGDDPLRRLLCHPLCAIGTNAASSASGPQNPGVTGAFPRFLGRYVRDLAAVPLEEAVRRMTSLPAARLGLSQLGRVAEGCWADLTLFDPSRIRDPGQPERLDAAPEGIRYVLVSGVPVLQDGMIAPGVTPGRVLRRGAT